MIVSLEKEKEEGKIPEWCLLEFQGSFSCSEQEVKNIQGEFLGDLNYLEDGTPFFLNGHHIIFGEEVKLRKPLAILCRNFEDDSIQKSYVVKAVVRKKILFSKRPRPVVAQELLTNNDKSVKVLEEE